MSMGRAMGMYAAPPHFGAAAAYNHRENFAPPAGDAGVGQQIAHGGAGSFAESRNYGGMMWQQPARPMMHHLGPMIHGRARVAGMGMDPASQGYMPPLSVNGNSSHRRGPLSGRVPAPGPHSLSPPGGDSSRDHHAMTWAAIPEQRMGSGIWDRNTGSAAMEGLRAVGDESAAPAVPTQTVNPLHGGGPWASEFHGRLGPITSPMLGPAQRRDQALVHPNSDMLP